jgi:hypothetical protein
VLALVKRPTALTNSRPPHCTLVHRLVDYALATLALHWVEGIATALARGGCPAEYIWSGLQRTSGHLSQNFKTLYFPSLANCCAGKATFIPRQCLLNFNF